MSKKKASAKEFMKEIEDLGWAVGKDLGEGAFGKVKLVTRRSDGQTAACKIMVKPKDLKKMKVIQLEYKIMKEMDHPYIVKCFEAVETELHVFLFLELMECGELFDKIVEMGYFTEKMAAQLSYNMLGALNYMHSKGIIHRDLKPENMLLSKGDDYTKVKLTDFGLSKMLDEESKLMKTPVGTPGYVAPEVLALKDGGYDHKVDVWSMGVIIYILLCGFPPFYADNDAQLFAKIKAGDYKFLSPYWDKISTTAKDFIRRMLTVDAKKRASIDELLADPWLADAAAKAAPPPGPPAGEEMDLMKHAEYKLKETEEKLAKQVQALQNTVVLLRAKNRFLAFGARQKDGSKSSAGSDGAVASSTGGGGGDDPAMVDVQINEAEKPAGGGCNCVIS